MKEKYGYKILSIILVAILLVLGSIFSLSTISSANAMSNSDKDTKLSFGGARDLTILNVKGILKPSEKPREIIRTKTVEFRLDVSECDIYPMSGGYVYLKVGDLKPSTAPGEPQLPMKTFVVKLPKNAKIINVAAVDGKYRAIENKLKIVPTPQPYMLGPEIQQNPNAGKFIPKGEVYRSNEYFNGKVVSYDVGCDNEYKYVFVRIYPVQYIPAQEKVILIEDVTITVYYKNEEQSSFQELFTTFQINAGNIIIAPKELHSHAKDLAEFHEGKGKGISTEVVNTTWIYENYREAQNPPYEGYKNSSIEGWSNITGYNYSLAKRIILFLRDNEVHPNLEYVTLLGNARLVPPSYYVYIDWPGDLGRFEPYNDWIPTDFFYSSPDYDLVPNYAIGRLPVNSPQEAEHVVQKIKAWNENVSGDWFKNAALIGGATFWTSGSRYYVGELATTACVNRGYLDGMKITKLYLSDGNNRPDKVQSIYQGGYGLIYHTAHGSGDAEWKNDPHEGWVDVINTTILKNLSRNSNVPIVLSFACMNGAFDTNIYPNRCYTRAQPISFGEALLLSNAGGIAYIGSSRISWAAWFVYLDEGYLNVIKEGYIDGMLSNVCEGYHGGVNILGDLMKTATKEYVIENDFSDVYNKIILFEVVLLGDPALQLPPQRSGVPYQQPFLTALNPVYYTTFFGISPEKDIYKFGGYPFYNTNTSITINSTTDSPKVFIKRVDIFNYTTVERIESTTKNNALDYVFTSSNETEYLVRVSSEDGKEGWLYLTAAKPWRKSGTILIVDDDAVKNYEIYYEDALTANGYAYDTWNLELRGNPDSSILTQYDVVIWLTGDDWNTLTNINQEDLTTYLNSGGKLFVSGQDIGRDLIECGNGEQFYHDYLHADYIQDSTGICILEGIIDDKIGNGLSINISEGDGANNQENPSEIAPRGGSATSVFNYIRDGCSAIRADTGVYKVVYFAFGFEAINNVEDRNVVMKRVIRWLSPLYWIIC